MTYTRWAPTQRSGLPEMLTTAVVDSVLAPAYSGLASAWEDLPHRGPIRMCEAHATVCVLLPSGTRLWWGTLGGPEWCQQGIAACPALSGCQQHWLLPTSRGRQYTDPPTAHQLLRRARTAASAA